MLISMSQFLIIWRNYVNKVIRFTVYPIPECSLLILLKILRWVNYFDGYVFSAQEKLMKPDRRIYERLIARYILNPEESIFIDDLKANTDAAKKLGMLAFTFNIDKLGELQEYISSH